MLRTSSSKLLSVNSITSFLSPAFPLPCEKHLNTYFKVLTDTCVLQHGLNSKMAKHVHSLHVLWSKHEKMLNKGFVKFHKKLKKLTVTVKGQTIINKQSFKTLPAFLLHWNQIDVLLLTACLSPWIWEHWDQNHRWPVQF